MRTNNLDLDIYLDELLGKRVNLDKTWIDRAVKASEFSN